mgnify:CR=1 FL=1
MTRNRQTPFSCWQIFVAQLVVSCMWSTQVKYNVPGIIAYLYIVPWKMPWDKWLWFYDIDRCQPVIMTVDKHELLFRILNRGLFLLWANCVHDLAVKTQALREFFILYYFAATWKRILIFFHSVSISSVHFKWFFFNDLTPINF